MAPDLVQALLAHEQPAALTRRLMHIHPAAVALVRPAIVARVALTLCIVVASPGLIHEVGFLWAEILSENGDRGDHLMGLQTS